MPPRPTALAAAFLALAPFAAIPAAEAAPIGVVAAPAPAPGSEIGARLRWGATGAEAGLVDNGVLMPASSLNTAGAPGWAVGRGHAFEITFRGATGRLGLSVDFNRDGDFVDANESTSTSVFAAPGATSYAGQGFSYLSIQLVQDTPTAALSNLAINGTLIGGFSAAPGSSTETYYAGAGTPSIGDWTITGSITFNAAGSAQERPVFHFRFRQPGEPTAGGAEPTAVSAPAGVAVLAMGLLGLAAVRRRRG